MKMFKVTYYDHMNERKSFTAEDAYELADKLEQKLGTEMELRDIIEIQEEKE